MVNQFSTDTKTNNGMKRRDVKQFSVHLRESTHREIKIALLRQGGKQDFSGLVEQLLTEYLSKQGEQPDVSTGEQH